MAKLQFRDLKADEIDCRIATINEKGMSLLLYKDARCDMNILDETVGAYNWMRSHSRDNANCTVSIWDEEKQQWISKEDVGTESNTEAVKGLASDSFKRACFNWGIGRELYTAPFIWIGSDKCNIEKKDNGKVVSYDKFSVKDITITDKKIIGLSIYNESKKAVVYTYGKTDAKVEKTSAAKAKAETTAEAKQEAQTTAPAQKQRSPARQKLSDYCVANGFTKEEQARIVKECGLNNKSTDQDYEKALTFAVAMKVDKDRKAAEAKNDDYGQLPFEV